MLELLGSLDQLKTILPKLKELLPVLKQYEATIPKQANENIMYLINTTSEKIYLYQVLIIEQDGKGVISKELNRWDLFELLDTFKLF